MDRADRPKISAAWTYANSPLIARKITSCTFMARSTAGAGYTPMAPPGRYPPRDQTGQITY